MTRVLLEVTNLETQETRYITVGGSTDVPDLVAGYALRYTQALLKLPTEPTPHAIALWPGGETEDDDAA